MENKTEELLNRWRRDSLNETEPVQRLLANKNTRPVAEAAVAFCVDGKPSPSPSWPKTSTWAQVLTARDELIKQQRA